MTFCKNLKPSSYIIIIISITTISLSAYYYNDGIKPVEEIVLILTFLLAFTALWYTAYSTEKNSIHQAKIIKNQYSTIKNMNQQLAELKTTNEIHTVALKEAYRPIMIVICETRDDGIYFKLINAGNRTAYDFNCDIDLSKWNLFLEGLKDEQPSRSEIDLSILITNFSAYKNYAPGMYRETMVAWSDALKSTISDKLRRNDTNDDVPITFKLSYKEEDESDIKITDIIVYDIKQVLTSDGTTVYTDNYYYQKITEMLQNVLRSRRF